MINDVVLAWWLETLENRGGLLVPVIVAVNVVVVGPGLRCWLWCLNLGACPGC